jgi:hypothetical protein
MNQRFKTLGLLIIIALSTTACGTQAGQDQQSQQTASKAVTYEVLLGKSSTDKEVVDFITSNNCSSVEQFQLCKDVGIALWINLEQVVETVYLYLNNADGFAPYNGELPFGLKFYDTLGAVEYKLGKIEVEDNSLHPALNGGLPDEGSSPDHMHYWAVYKRLSMTIVYNSPFVDEDATIYAILVKKGGTREPNE